MHLCAIQDETAKQDKPISSCSCRRCETSLWLSYLLPQLTVLVFAGDPNAQVASEITAGGTYNTAGNFVGSADEKLAFIHAKHTIIVIPPNSSRECRPQTYPCFLTVCDKDHKLIGDKTFRVDHGENVVLEQNASATASSGGQGAGTATVVKNLAA